MSYDPSEARDAGGEGAAGAQTANEARIHAAPRGRTFTPVVKTIRNFALAMQEAEKHRSILKARYGFDDKQIGTLATAALAKHGQRPYHDLARSAIRAKRRLDTH
jgi:hypothetical protein